MAIEWGQNHQSLGISRRDGSQAAEYMTVSEKVSISVFKDQFTESLLCEILCDNTSQTRASLIRNSKGPLTESLSESKPDLR